MEPRQFDHTGLTLLATRAALGFILLWHGLPKVLDPASASQQFGDIGFPGVLGPIVGGFEVVTGVLILVGYLTPIAVLVAFGIIAVATVSVHLPAGSVDASLERNALILVSMAVLLSFGPGKYSLDAVLTRPSVLPSVLERAPE